jgi:acetyl esterase/lipase
MNKMLLWPEGTPNGLGHEEEDKPTLVPYLIETDSPAPAVVICPGGGYATRAEHEGEPIARWLNSLGIHALVVHYRVAPYRHPNPLMDAQRAIRIARYAANEWRIDPNRIGILGFSAGGHLASAVGTDRGLGDQNDSDPINRESAKPNLMVLCYPVISFKQFTHQGSISNLAGDQPSEELLTLLSTELQVNSETPPTFLWHTADDAAVPVEGSMLFATQLSKHRVPFELHVFEHGRHGLGLAKRQPEVGVWTDLCATWLRKKWFS